MTEAPERIWTCNETTDIFITEPQEDTTEYIRSDVSDALVTAAREEALRGAQKGAHDHKGFAPSMTWPPNAREGYNSGQIDMQRAISDAILALITKDADNG